MDVPDQSRRFSASGEVAREAGVSRFLFSPSCSVYGASPRMRLYLVLNNLTAWAFTTGRVRIMSDGAPWRPLVHIEDIARAFAAVLEAPRDDIHAQAFNVGVDTENYQVKDLAELVREAVPNSAVAYSGPSAPDPRSYRVDFGKIGRIVPAFQPLWNARKGVAELCESFQKASIKADDPQSRNYIRPKQLKHLLDTQVCSTPRCSTPRNWTRICGGR
jgi:hypothetical protein